MMNVNANLYFKLKCESNVGPFMIGVPKKEERSYEHFRTIFYK
jgi:hypothetical protein